MKFLLPGILIFGSLLLKAQYPFRISIENATLMAGDTLFPFWFSANRQGKIENRNSFLNVTDLFLGQIVYTPDSSLSVHWGGNFVAGLGQANYYQVNRAYAGVSFKGWNLKGGMFYDPVVYAGLSTTNGNLARSTNARPYPKLRFSTAGYKPVPGLKKWLGFKAEYTEGILNDDRIVDKARMHHKSFYLSVHPFTAWKIKAGLEHVVMWGGTSPDERFGAMPQSFKAYLFYISGRKGDESFPQMEQNNVAGNQLGTYQVEIEKQFTHFNAAFYISHLFEDHSGKNLRNFPDKLLGLHIGLINKTSFITDLLYEYTNTRHQSIRNETDKEPDSYFNHSIYASGYTYQRRVLGSPLFYPVIVNNNVSEGIRSNRFFAHHVGMKGNFPQHLAWKGMITYIQHLGLYRNPYENLEKQVSGLLEMQYVHPGFPVELGLSISADAGNTISKNGAVQFWIAKTW